MLEYGDMKTCASQSMVFKNIEELKLKHIIWRC